MSAFTSPVASPRKGKHVRSGVSTISQSTQLGADLYNKSNGISSLTTGLDLNTLDPDEAFVKLSIREIQSIEESLQANHEQISQTLKSLVAKRYRDMLGTANTLIEMSSSASNLVARLDAVREGVTAVDIQPDEPYDIEGNVAPQQDTKQNGTDLKIDDHSNILSIAAATKLLAEAPDEIWRAIEEATELDQASSSSQSSRLSARKLRNHRAANTLKAAYIIVLCQKTWEWLSTAIYQTEAESTTNFPYVANQWLAVQSMRKRVSLVAHQGFAGWYKSASDHSRWEEFSSSYVSTLTYISADALLQGTNLNACRLNLLQMRQKSIVEQLDNKVVKSSHTLSRSIRCITDTMIHCLQAFGQINNSEESLHLASIFQQISLGRERSSAHFPPQAVDIIKILPSGDILTKFLPELVLNYCPKMNYDDALQCQQTTPEVLQKWCQALREEDLRKCYKISIDRIETISAIGEAQIQIRESLDRSLSMMVKMIKKVDIRESVEKEVQAFVILVEELLLKRADILCRNRTAELSLAISESTSSALRSLHSNQQTNEFSKVEGKTLKMESAPILFALDSDIPSANMQSKLRLHTPLVQQVLSSVEGRAQILSKEMTSYTAYIEKDAVKRKKRQNEGRGKMGQMEDLEKQIERVLESYRTAFDSARLVLVDELKNQLSIQRQTGDELNIASDVQNLLIARIASALQKSNVLRSTATVAAKSNDELFLQKLAMLRSDIISHWTSKTVAQAIQSYKSKVKSCKDIYTDEQNQGRPSIALAEALLQLVDCIDSIGCGYQSEATILGKQVFLDFIKLWLQESNGMTGKNTKDCYDFDTRVLLILLKEHTGVDEQVKRLSDICKASIDLDLKKQIECAIQRLRVILHPLRSTQQTFQLSNRDKVPSQNTLAPPLPMLTLATSKEKVALF